MLQNKPRDENGVTIPHDHDEINDNDWLLRGISNQHIINGRVTSGAFKSSTDPYKGMSVDLEKLDGARNYPNERHLGAVKFLTEIPRQKELLVGYDSLTENDAHSQVWRFDENIRNITSSQARHMSKNCEWEIEIEGVNLPG